MSRELKAKLVTGKPIHFDFNIEGQIITFELVCPMCGNKFFVFSMDKEMGGCTDPSCPCVLLERLPDAESDMSKVEWKL